MSSGLLIILLESSIKCHQSGLWVIEPQPPASCPPFSFLQFQGLWTIWQDLYNGLKIEPQPPTSCPPFSFLQFQGLWTIWQDLYNGLNVSLPFDICSNRWHNASGGEFFSSKGQSFSPVTRVCFGFSKVNTARSLLSHSPGYHTPTKFEELSWFRSNLSVLPWP